MLSDIKGTLLNPFLSVPFAIKVALASICYHQGQRQQGWQHKLESKERALSPSCPAFPFSISAYFAHLVAEGLQ